MSLRFNTAPIIHFDEDPETGSLRVEAIARHAGVLRYQNFDGTHRYEFVAPELNNARNPDGRPWVAQLAGATCTNEHPSRLIKNDTALREQVQVGEVEPEIEVYQDGRVKVFLNVWDSQTIDEIKRGDKRGISLGYECAVEKTDGVWKGQRFDAKQTLPISVDPAVIVRNPRAPEALIKSYARTDSEDGYIDIAWHCDEDDHLDSLADEVAALLERRDGCGGKVYSKKGKKKKPIALMDALDSYIGDQQMNSLVIGGNEYRLDSDATRAIVEALSQHWDAPCGRGWVGTKPGCKRKGKGGAAPAPSGASSVSKNQARTAELRAKFGKTAKEQSLSAAAKARASTGKAKSAAVNIANSAGGRASDTERSRANMADKAAMKRSQPKGGAFNPNRLAAEGNAAMSKMSKKERKAAETAFDLPKEKKSRAKKSSAPMDDPFVLPTATKAKRSRKKKTDSYSYSYSSDYGQRIYSRA